MVVALETSLHHAREVTALSTGLVDADAYRLESRKIEQKVVDQIAELAVIMLSDDGTQAHAVLSAQRMIRHEGIELAVVLIRQILQAHNLYIHLQIAHAFGEPLRTGKATTFPQELVDLVLVNDFLKPRNQETRHKLRLASHLALQYLFYIYRFLN